MTEKKFVKLLEEKFIKEGFLTKREVGVGYGVADLVLFRVNPDKCAIRNKNKQYKKIKNEEFFKIFDYLPELGANKKVDLNSLTKNLNIPKATLKYKYLKTLENNGFIKKVDNKYYFKINGWMPIAKEIIAIEAKLKDWKKGFVQANRYKSFANKAYLAMPAARGHLVDRELLKKHNIGLILFDPDKHTKKISRVKATRPLNRHKFNLAAEFILGKQQLKKCFS
ncbi:MAG: hypothetical protein WC310_02335 [Patescibacteria group bacterium]|jgi:predicted transcriptional regulator